MAASVECSSHVVEVTSHDKISRARNFFATFGSSAYKMATVPSVNKFGQIIGYVYRVAQKNRTLLSISLLNIDRFS